MKNRIYALIALVALGGLAIWAIATPKAPMPQVAVQAPQEATTTATSTPTAPTKPPAGQVSEGVKIVAPSPPPAPPQKQTAGPEITSQNIIALTNNARIDAGLKPLRESSKLDAAAGLKIGEMVGNSTFAHDFTPGGMLDPKFFTAAGYSFKAAGENLGVAYLDVQNPWTVEALQTEFEQSPEHEKNIVNSLYTEIGVSVAQGEYQGRPVTFAAIEFGLPQ